jgi:autotransporter-associated beta strand protein
MNFPTLSPASRPISFPLAVALVIVCLGASSTEAQTKTWTGNRGGGGANRDWSRDENWQDEDVPASGDALIFAGTNRLTDNNNNFNSYTFNGITFNSSAGAFTLSGNPITLGGNVTNDSVNTQTIDLNMGLSATRTFHAAAGDLAIGGVLSSAGGLTKTGNNTLSLTAANTFTGPVTIAAGTLQLGNGSATGSLSTASSITNQGTLAFNRSNTITQGTDFASVIAGAGGITKLNTNTLVLNGTNTYTGPTVVNAGTLQAGAAAGGQAFGNLSAVTVSSGAGLALNGFNQTIGSLAGNGTVSLGTGSATLTLGGDNSSTVFGGVVNGSGSVTKVGTGTFAVTNTVVPAGFTITVNGGTFQLGNGGAGGALTSPSTVVNNATYAWNRSDNREQGGTSVITGTGVFLKRGAGTYTLSGTNSYSGGTRIEEGTLRVNNPSAIGATTGSLTIHGGSLDLANFNIAVGNLTGTGGTITSSVGGSRTLTIGNGNAGGGTYQGVIADGTGTTSLVKTGTGTITLAGNNTFTGATTINGGTLRIGSGGTSGSIVAASSVTNNGTLIYDRSDDVTLTYGISGSGSVTKEGAGLLILTQANTYSGGTIVNAGTLRVQNTTGSATGSGTVVINNGGKLMGAGSIAGDIVVNPGGILSLGASIEVLTSGAAMLNDTSTFIYELDSSAPLGLAADLQVANGDLSLFGIVSLDVGDLASSPTAFDEGTTFSLINYADTWNGGLFTVNGDAIGNGETFTDGLNTWRLDYTATTGGVNFSSQYSNANFVNIVAVPEPPVLAIVAAGGVGFLMLRRRRHQG